ncbi:glycine cleavage system protein GcvH [Streptomyces sp. Ag109_O5-10]|uniref:glycine cleavage system protein GcvH n=1 Tax=Streptomyces sp. Ag109_O5-10 TaxID=1855349 RepID=UPI0008985962|nr:glycine cleavage system protein GcvH [Streptomyces sp. Ag109_O5-10]SEF19039.1 glycine cleavage system H protein [Streptomyces sp. Ag109_O5-10]
MIPEDLRYSQEHMWVTGTGDHTVRVGMTDFCQEQLNDVVLVNLPEVGRRVSVGEPMAEVESTKAMTAMLAPVSGEILAVNDVLNVQPEVVNSDPFGEGWFVELRTDDPASVTGLLDAARYAELIDSWTQPDTRN